MGSGSRRRGGSRETAAESEGRGSGEGEGRGSGGGDEGEKREWGIGGGSRGEGIRPRGGLGENSFNCSVGRKNVLLLKSVVVALFVEGRYYYT